MLEPLSGTAPYQMEMQIPLGDARQHKHGFINVTSTLQGARVDLPEPFAKTAQRKRDMRVWLSLDRNPSLMSVRYGKLFELSVQSKDGEWQKGNLSLGDQKAVLPVENHFAVTGSVERFSTTEWMAVLSRVQGSAQRYQEPLKSNKLVLLDQSRLDIGEFVLGQTSLGRQQLSLQRQGHNWLVQTAGDAIDGSALLPAYIFADANLFPRQAVPVDVQIDRITWPRVEEETKTETTPEATPETIPAADDWQPVDISPRVLPPLDVTIRRLQWGDGDFGDWALKLRPVSDGMRLRDVRFQMRGVEFSGEGSWREQGGNRSSQLKGQYSSNSIANVMRAWGSEPTMDSKTLNGKLDIQWPGAPFEFAVSRSRGSLDLKMTDGTFYNVKSGVVGKFWGALNFETLLRRLQLNFKDLQEKDMVYDEIKANARIHDGVLAVQDLQLESPAIKLQTNGNVDLNNSQLDMVMKVTVPGSRVIWCCRQRRLAVCLHTGSSGVGGGKSAGAYQFDKLTTISTASRVDSTNPSQRSLIPSTSSRTKSVKPYLSPDKGRHQQREQTMKCRVAAIQMVSTYDVDANLRSAEQQLRAAADAGVELAVLPENFAVLDSDNLLRWADEEQRNRISRTFVETMARTLGLWIVAGTIPMPVATARL
ncbi:MAG: AsmA-like C-terminal region-containing protein [Gammaproteobacteria bacterium]